MLETGASGLPDIAWLTRLANEMFRSQPDSPVPFAASVGIGAPAASTPLPPGSPAESAAAQCRAPPCRAPARRCRRKRHAERSGVSAAASRRRLRSVSGFDAAAADVGASDAAAECGRAQRARFGRGDPGGKRTAWPARTAARWAVSGRRRHRRRCPACRPWAWPTRGEADLRGLPGLSQPVSIGGYGVSPFDPTPLPDLSALDATNPGDEALRALPGGLRPQRLPRKRPTPRRGAPAPSLYFLDEAGHGGVPAAAATARSRRHPPY